MLLIAVAVTLSATAAAEPVVVTVPLKGPAQVEDLRARGIEIITYTKYGMDVLADEKQLDYLMSRRYPVTVAPRPQRTASQLDENLGDYTTFAEMESTLAAWDTTTAYSDIFDRFSLGTSIEGRTIHGFKISDNVTVDEDEPEVLYIANHHAREIMTVDIVMMFADTLLTGYGSDATITDYVDNREVYFVPMMNPDGHVYVEQNHDGSPNSWWRKNRRLNADLTYGVDLNRNWGYQWGYDDTGSHPYPTSPIYRGTGPFSEPENQAVRDFVNQREITIWLSYHTYGELLLFPWNYDYFDTPDHDVFVALGEALTESNGYLAGNPKSGAIYLVNGGSDDWGYGEQGTKDKIFAFTPEVNSGTQGGFGPDDSLIQPTFDLLLDMNLLVLEYADNPYRVMAPWRPTQYAITEPYGNAVHRVSWSAASLEDPNPTVAYQVECCENPFTVTDDGTMLDLWSLDGFTVASGHTGDGYYSGSGDNKRYALSMEQPYEVASASDTLSFWITYDIETDWDYGYVEVSTDGGDTWAGISGSITTTTDPNGNNRGNGFTGQSGGWVFATFPLGDYDGQEVYIRFSYLTDGAVIEPGYTVDDIHPVATCNEVVALSPAGIDTTIDVTPDTTGTFRYRVRALDADAQASLWSGTRHYEALTLTAADEPLRYRTRLEGNYPNPFNPSTRIPYAVGGEVGGGTAPVRLRVYSVTGALVATLVDERRAPGSYEAVWNGTNDAGQELASGIYFAQLIVGPEAAVTRKLVLLK
jgi:hypothetical protein